jgi:hypothetical protein
VKLLQHQDKASQLSAQTQDECEVGISFSSNKRRSGAWLPRRWN